MAQKRMFDKAILDTDKFMDLSLSSKALYFLLGMEADDEGFVSPKKVMRVHGGNDDDLRLLVAKRFLIPFKSGVVVITDWQKNNWLDSRRIKPTEYQIEKKLLTKKDNQYLLLSECLASASPEESSIEEYRGEQLADKSAEVPVVSSPEKPVKKDGFNPQGAEILKAFEEIDPKNKTYYGNKTQRSACDFLLKEYGLEKVLSRIEQIKSHRGVSFFPIILSPYDLKEKGEAFRQALIKENKKQSHE